MAFQAVSDDQFNANGEFTVKTSKSMAIFVGLIFLLLALGIYFSTQSKISFGLLAASLYSFYRSTKDVVIMNISRKGFFMGESWLQTGNIFLPLNFLMRHQYLAQIIWVSMTSFPY